MTLPNQQLTITVHQLNGDDEPILSLSLESCRRLMEVSRGISQKYLSGDCMWGHLQHQQDIFEDSKKTETSRIFNKKQHLVRILSFPFFFFLCHVLVGGVSPLC